MQITDLNMDKYQDWLAVMISLAMTIQEDIALKKQGENTPLLEENSREFIELLRYGETKENWVMNYTSTMVEVYMGKLETSLVYSFPEEDIPYLRAAAEAVARPLGFVRP